ncbi:MAG TPA: M20/M25/M40 family metallo-hydrolase [Chitinophagaceae bacterium]|nr:M20/M25/M40 family metallo-hydrolase [Chitinophagaceae bacterium]
MRKLFSSVFLLYSINLFSQQQNTLAIREHCKKNETGILDEFVSFLSIPNVSADTPNIHKNAAFIVQMMRNRGIQNVQLLDGISQRVAPVVYGEVKSAGAKQTIVFYAHYDGQPVNPAQWMAGFSPFVPKYQNDRIYARGSSDDKGGVAAILNAYEAIVKTGMKPTVNIKFFFEGEEEVGSPKLGEILEKNNELLQSDAWIICDGPVHQSGKKQIVFGVRGDAHLDLTVYGPKRPLHSGHYGNWAPNPALMLAKLLASMKDESGRVTVNGFYDDVTPLSEAELKALKDVPSADEQMKNELGLAAIEMPGKSLSESINLPSLNINGMQSGNVGKMASNQIPTFANAVMDLRLVLGNDWKKQQQKVIDHIKLQGFTVIDHEPTDAERNKYAKLIKVIAGENSYNAQRTSMNLPIAKSIIEAVRSTTSEQVVLQPTLGGSLPLIVIENYLHAKTITVPIANHDNNQHAENENIKLANFWSGIETMAALMMMKN